MKTNQTMMVRIGDYTQPIEHLTMMGNLNSLWLHGNGIRAKKGLSPLMMNHWMVSSQTRELVEAIEKRYFTNFVEYEIAANGTTKYKGKLNSIRTKMGKGGGTFVHLMLMLDAAAWLDADFKVEMYDTFINNKILQWRDDSGEEFKNLNVAIDAYLPDRIGKDNKGCYIQTAKLLKTKIAPDGDSWNMATYNQLELRSKIETKLVDILKIGLVRDWNHFKEVIEKL